MAAVLPFAPYILAAAGAVVKGVSGKQTAEYNQKVAKQQGNTALAIGELRAARISERNKQLTSKQIAGYAASGVDLTGTPTDVLMHDATRGELDALNARYEGIALRSSFFAQADQYNQQGNDAVIGAALGVGASIIGGMGAGASTGQLPAIKPGGSMNVEAHSRLA